jgi:hypothetical protein
MLWRTKPGDIPVEQPTRFDVIIVNVTITKVLGLRIPETFLVRANGLIDQIS